MSSVNLNVVGPETFGARLPTVFIQSIEVDQLDHPYDAYRESAKITATLSIKFTKPPHVDEPATHKFIDDYLHNLMLYAYITGYDEEWTTALENENLDLLSWNEKLDWMHGLGVDTSAIAYGNTLKNLAGGDDGASLILDNSFDGEGNEIMEISGITCEFAYKYSGHGTLDEPRPLEDVGRLFFFATVGPSRSYIESTVLTDTDDTGTAKTVSEQTYNSFFGNITYYQVLERTEVASRYYSQYSRPDGSPYLELVLQSVNGKFYSTDNYGYTDLKGAFEATIAEFSAERASDSILNKNISDLEAIILGEYNRTNMLGEIANYSSTYPNKNQNTASGRFFNSFVVTYAEVLQIVQSQEELSQKLYLDSLVTDRRASGLIGTWSLTDNFSKYDKGLSSSPSSDFIPQYWFQCERQAWSVLPLAESTVFGSTYISADAAALGTWYGDIDAETVISGLFEGEGTEFSAMYEPLVAHYIEEGYSTDIAEDLAREEVEYQLSSGDTGTASELLGSLTSLEDMEDLNFIVRNKGYFYFDYEKGLRTQTSVAQALNLSKIQQYFRKAVPYKYCYLKEVSLSREELYVGMPGITGDHENSIVCKIYADFTDASGNYENYDGTEAPSRPKLPKQRRTGLDWEHENVAASSATLAMALMDVHRFKYLRPVATDAILGTQLVSYLKFKNFDVANPVRSQRLDGHNDLGTETSYEGLGPVLDGYRLMCFEFSDLMDDDVAYYNASSEGLADADARKDNLKELNDLGTGGEGHPATVYKIKVQVVDDTYAWANDFYEYCLDIFNQYDAYCETSSDICSFNNLTNSYNQFFIDAINARYPDSNTKPWVIGAHLAVALSDILFNPDPISEDGFDGKVLQELMKIAPSTGNLTNTLLLRETLVELLSYLGPIEADATLDPSAATSPREYLSYWKYLGDTFGYITVYNNQITFGDANTGPIYGNFFPDITGPDMFSPREAAPVIVIPRAAFMGGRTDDITAGTGGHGDESSEEAGTGTAMTESSLYAGVIGETAFAYFDREEILGAESFSYVPGGFLEFRGSDGTAIALGAFASSDATPTGHDAWMEIMPQTDSLVKVAYDEIFLPYNADDWRFRALAPSTGGSFDTWRRWINPSTQEAISAELNNTPFVDAMMGGETYTVAAKWAHEILMRSSVDAEINSTGTSARRRRRGGTGPGSPGWRRSYRTLADIAYLLDQYYIPEAQRRIREEDENRHSYIVRTRQNLEGHGSGSGGTGAPAGATPLSGGIGDAAGATVAMHTNILVTLVFIRNKCVEELLDPTMTTAGEAPPVSNLEGLRSIRTYGGIGADRRGISYVVSADDYPGTTELVSDEEMPDLGTFLSAASSTLIWESS